MAAFIGLRVDEQAKARLEELAKRQGVSVNSLLKELVEERASNIPNADLLRLDRFKRALSDTNVSALELIDRLKALRDLKADIESEVLKLRDGDRDKGNLIDWLLGNVPQVSLKGRLKLLESQLATCDACIHEIRAHIFGSRSATEPKDESGKHRLAKGRDLEEPVAVPVPERPAKS
jgi:hypothetical protein